MNEIPGRRDFLKSVALVAAGLVSGLKADFAGPLLVHESVEFYPIASNIHRGFGRMKVVWSLKDGRKHTTDFSYGRNLLTGETESKIFEDLLVRGRKEMKSSLRRLGYEAKIITTEVVSK